MEYLDGLDLGQSQDYTALTIVEMHEPPSTSVTFRQTSIGLKVVPPEEPVQTRPNYDVRHLQRYPLGTSYPAIVSDVCSLLARAPLHERVQLIVDGTGVGRAVVDLFRRAPRRDFPLYPVIITGGDSETFVDGYYRVPKRDLVSAVQVPLQNKLLRFAERLPERETLMSELTTFQVKISVRRSGA
jgi:hypothetical protein